MHKIMDGRAIDNWMLMSLYNIAMLPAPRHSDDVIHPQLRNVGFDYEATYNEVQEFAGVHRCQLKVFIPKTAPLKKR